MLPLGGPVMLRTPEPAVNHVYRGAAADFVPDTAGRVAVTLDTSLVDPSGAFTSWYKIAAVDVHGNQSAWATASPGVFNQSPISTWVMDSPTEGTTNSTGV